MQSNDFAASKTPYVDDVTGTAYPDPRTLINVYIKRFSDKVSVAIGREAGFAALDADGYSCVVRGSATVGINLFEESAVLMFLCRIMPVPKENQALFCRKLLELNFLATADGAFAIDQESNDVYLRAVRTAKGLDYDEFEEMLNTVATVADEWDDKLIADFG